MSTCVDEHSWSIIMICRLDPGVEYPMKIPIALASQISINDLNPADEVLPIWRCVFCCWLFLFGWTLLGEYSFVYENHHRWFATLCDRLKPLRRDLFRFLSAAKSSFGTNPSHSTEVSVEGFVIVGHLRLVRGRVDEYNAICGIHFPSRRRVLHKLAHAGFWKQFKCVAFWEGHIWVDVRSSRKVWK